MNNLDRFKQVNDAGGHLAGRVSAEPAAALRDFLAIRRGESTSFP